MCLCLYAGERSPNRAFVGGSHPVKQKHHLALKHSRDLIQQIGGGSPTCVCGCVIWISALLSYKICSECKQTVITELGVPH